MRYKIYEVCSRTEYQNVNFLEWLCVVGVFPDFQSGIVMIWVSQMCLMQSRCFGKLHLPLCLFSPLLPFGFIIPPCLPCWYCAPWDVVFLYLSHECVYICSSYPRLTQLRSSVWKVGLFTHTPKPWLDFPNGRCLNIPSLLPFSLRVLKISEIVCAALRVIFANSFFILFVLIIL